MNKTSLQQLLEKYQIILGLRDWEIGLTEDEALSEEAQTKILFNDYKAVIRINKSNNDEEKEKSLIHELLHLIYRDAYDIFTDTAENEYIKEYCTRQHERAIEKTAKIIYKLTHRDDNPSGTEKKRLEPS